MKCLLATKNRGKLLEIQEILGDFDIQLICLEDLAFLPDAPENGLSFAENARSKALFYSKRTDLPAIADDSGLVVDALGGKPGVFSARYAKTDGERIGRVLRELESAGALDAATRSARFICAICMVVTERELIEVEGKVEGEITTTPRGERGFGYDPIFYYPPLQETFAEMSRSAKNKVSHRGRALEQFKLRLEEVRRT